MSKKQKRAGAVAWAEMIRFAVEAAGKDPSFHRRVTDRLNRRTGERVHKNQVWHWLRPDGPEPKTGTGLLLVEAAHEVLAGSKGQRAS